MSKARTVIAELTEKLAAANTEIASLRAALDASVTPEIVFVNPAGIAPGPIDVTITRAETIDIPPLDDRAPVPPADTIDIVLVDGTDHRDARIRELEERIEEMRSGLTPTERTELENLARDGVVSRCARDVIARALGIEREDRDPGRVVELFKAGRA